jgi:Phage terminase, small subunit
MPDLTPPPDLPPNTLLVWQETGTRLHQLNRADTTDPNTLRAYCQNVTAQNRAASLLDRTDILIDVDGTATPNPVLDILNKSGQTIARLSTTLGLDKPPRTDTPTLTGPAAPLAPQQPAAPMRQGRYPETCVRCEGDPHDQPWHCAEHRMMHGVCHRKGRTICHGALVAGTNTCRMHQGSKSREMALATRAQRRKHWEPIAVNPAQALLDEVAYWNGLCLYLDEIVGGLDAGDMVWGLVSRTSVQGDTPGVTVVEQAQYHAYVRWQERAHSEKSRVAALAMQSDAVASMVGWQQAQGMAIVRAFKDGLGMLDLDERQWTLARSAMERVLQSLLTR